MKRIVILFYSSLVFARADFKTVDFEGYGMKVPQMKFIFNGEKSVQILKKSDAAVFVDVRHSDKVPFGISLNLDRYLVENPALVDAALCKKLIEMIGNPLNYGDAQPELAHTKKKITVNSALEMTDGISFIRMYFDKEREYAWFYSQETGASPVWKIAPELSALLGKAQGGATPINLK